ncbi:hydroxymethylglutaryl-CoA lyase [Olivibacter sp. SDN3]|uniref:hydroxymethylglutaryl-CoA lyase n=1 Tax=Olivibacter sp. SDN3 TaxID=2764720 RepID=UPI0016515B2A|nr:hydroxymethylglutaryl-CoA lyase [Olivibacter sp. SDN3]QNL49127.1 hydroxymethylglutaryl-CoA lyase [Olivibacter sp. SDN3]
MIEITECPRDAMQGIHHFIPTEIKATYLNLLLKVGFDRLDFGSFVSPKAIPQLIDTVDVLHRLDLSQTSTKLLAIIANVRGAIEACTHKEISFLGFPFSVSETFQLRNTNAGITDSLERVKEIISLCDKHNKQPLVYLSMAFGNPYNDPWSPEIVTEYTEQLVQMGIKNLMLADTTGVSTPENIKQLYDTLHASFPTIDLGMHLHSTPPTVVKKIEAAFNSGCKRFDTALGGYGGCPMASDKLTGNIATEALLSFLKDKGNFAAINEEALFQAQSYSNKKVFRP